MSNKQEEKMSKRKYWVVEDADGGLMSWFEATPKVAAQNLRGIDTATRSESGRVPNFTLRQIDKTRFDHIDNNEKVAGLVVVVPGEDVVQ
jgi:hypothetical protein